MIAVSGPMHARSRVIGALTVTSYAILGSLLVATRLFGLDRSYWHDEIWTVHDFVEAGPREILAGPYISEQPRALQPARLGDELSWSESPRSPFDSGR